jgi:hypothetical protein
MQPSICFDRNDAEFSLQKWQVFLRLELSSPCKHLLSQEKVRAIEQRFMFHNDLTLKEMERRKERYSYGRS